MPDIEKTLDVVREWVNKAENDLEAARRLVRSGSGFPSDAVCFHAQQCVEKYMKSYLAFAGIEFPKTHDIRLLLSLLPIEVRPDIKWENKGLSQPTRLELAIRVGLRFPPARRSKL
jgi:HEPN domain-containing protein